jgi:hypothetical protein
LHTNTLTLIKHLSHQGNCPARASRGCDGLLPRKLSGPIPPRQGPDQRRPVAESWVAQLRVGTVTQGRHHQAVIRVGGGLRHRGVMLDESRVCCSRGCAYCPHRSLGEMLSIVQPEVGKLIEIEPWLNDLICKREVSLTRAT